MWHGEARNGGSVWNNPPELDIGLNGGSGNSLVISNGGTMVASTLVVGLGTTSCDNFVSVSGGILYVTNSTHTAVLDVNDGTLTFSGGTIVVDTVVLTNSCGHFVHSRIHARKRRGSPEPPRCRFSRHG
jgi:hypothetical protein